jgi:short subunit dehydrogenase-like uncharacterized protein
MESAKRPHKAPRLTAGTPGKSAQIVLFGATGFTGRRVAEALVRRGVRPVLAGRDRGRLEALREALGGELEIRRATVGDPGTIAAAVEPGDILVTTVGPFGRLGDAAARASVDTGAHYLDLAGEPAFIRHVFDRYGPRAESAGVGMLPAFATEWVLGNLAGALALERAGPDAVRVDTGYFLLKGSRPIGVAALARSFAPASIVSGLSLAAEPGFEWRGGRLVAQRWARRRRRFDVEGRPRDALSIGGSEHIALPRQFARLRDVNVYLGWLGPLSRALRTASPVVVLALRRPSVRRAAQRLVQAAADSRGGPSAEHLAEIRSHTVAVAYDPAGNELSRAVVRGPELYGATAELLAWGAVRVAAGELRGTGALGPVEAFGLEALREGCSSAGLTIADDRDDRGDRSDRSEPAPEALRR